MAKLTALRRKNALPILRDALKSLREKSQLPANFHARLCTACKVGATKEYRGIIRDLLKDPEFQPVAVKFIESLSLVPSEFKQPLLNALLADASRRRDLHGLSALYWASRKSNKKTTKE